MTLIQVASVNLHPSQLQFAEWPQSLLEASKPPWLRGREDRLGPRPAGSIPALAEQREGSQEKLRDFSPESRTAAGMIFNPKRGQFSEY